MKIIQLFIIGGVLIFTGCATDLYPSTKQVENSFSSEHIEHSADLTFTAPNFSALHKPPFMSGFAYLESYDRESVCTGEKSYIGKITATRANKTQFSKLPAGAIIANVGYHAAGATGGGLKGNTYFSLNIEPNEKYTITLTEARPLVTSYSITITKTDVHGAEAEVPHKRAKSLKAICS